MNLQDEARQFLADYKKMGISFIFDKTNGKARAVEDNYGKHYIAKAAMDELASAYRLHLAVIKELEERKEASRQIFKPDNKDLRGKNLDAQDLAAIKELEEFKEVFKQKLKPRKNLRGKILDAQDKIQEAVKLINKADSEFDDLRVSMGHKNKNWQYRIFKAQSKLQDVLKLINEVGCGLEDLRIDAELINNA